MKRNLIGIISVTFLLIAPSEVARAKKKDQSPEETQRKIKCMQEISNICPEFSQGGKKSLECLKANEAKIAPECRTTHYDKHLARQAKQEKKLQDLKSACGAELATHCAEEDQTKPLKLRRCLKKHKPDLSAQCREFL